MDEFNVNDNEIKNDESGTDIINNENTDNHSDEYDNKQAADALKESHSSGESKIPGESDTLRESDTLKSSSFYSESYKKPGRKNKNGLVQLILVALISSILGGTVVASFFQFVVPAMSPSVRNYFSKLIPGASTNNTTVQSDASGLIKKVEIVQNGESAVATIAEKVGPSVVGIKVTAKVSGFFGLQESQPQGSGIIIRSDGYIMTNNHVIQDAMSGNTKNLSSGSKIEVILPNKQDEPYTAKVVGRDTKTDLAVLKIEATGLTAVEMGDSDKLKVGEQVVAIGNPGGLEFMGSVTTGVISGLNRSIPLEDGKDLKLIQTDAAINPGNSGGALVNSQGQLIGINTAKISASGFEGLGFAIPVNKAKEITDSLIQYTYVKGRPMLGIMIDQRFNKDIADQYKVPNGVLVADVNPLTAAYKAGIKAGDIITKFDGQAVTSYSELEELKNKHKPGDTVKIEIYRDNETKTVQVKLDEDQGN